MKDLALLYVLSWNVYIGRNVKAVLRSLRPLLNEHRPHIVALSEATRLYEHLDGLGYNVVQLKPKAKRKGDLPGDADIALLIRKDIKIKRRFTMRMLQFWRGPKHGLPQDPRVYRWVKIKWNGRTWKIGAAHIPFGKTAVAESRSRLIKWFKSSPFGRPTILVLDANMSLKEFEQTIATPGGAEANGDHIDLEGHKYVELKEVKNLGKNGSDHPAMLFGYASR